MNKKLIIKNKELFLNHLKDLFISEQGCANDLYIKCKGCPFNINPGVYGCSLYYDDVQNAISKDKRKENIINIVKDYYGEEILFDWML